MHRPGRGAGAPGGLSSVPRERSTWPTRCQSPPIWQGGPHPTLPQSAPETQRTDESLSRRWTPGPVPKPPGPRRTEGAVWWLFDRDIRGRTRRMPLPAGLSSLQPWAIAQSKTVSRRWRTRLSVLFFSVQMGVRTARTAISSPVCSRLRETRRWPGCSLIGPGAWGCSKSGVAMRSLRKRHFPL